MLYKETVKGETFELLKTLMNDESLKEFHLAGGTALALYLGHRISIDLDLFSQNPFDVYKLNEHLENKYSFKSTYTAKNTLKGEINGVKIDCITHNYTLVQPISIQEDNIRLYSIDDIGAMKLGAIAMNGTRLKDFIDISYLSTKLSLKDMMNAYQYKYGSSNMLAPVKGLLFYDDINFKEPIELIGNKFSWEKVKQHISDMVNNDTKKFNSLSIEQHKDYSALKGLNLDERPVQEQQSKGRKI